MTRKRKIPLRLGAQQPGFWCEQVQSGNFVAQEPRLLVAVKGLACLTIASTP